MTHRSGAKDLRQAHPIRPPDRPPERPRWPLAVGGVGVAIVAVLVLALGAGALAPGSSPSPGASASLPGGSVSGGSLPGSSAATSSAPSGAAASPGPSASPAPSAGPEASSSPSTTLGDVLVVPVTQFRTGLDTTTARETAAALGGTSKTFAALELVEGDADGILSALGLERSDAAKGRLVLVKDAAAVSADLAAHRDRLAFLRADQVTPSVRALGWGKDRLFGVGAVKSAAAWPLRARLAVAEGTTAFDPAAAWTLVAGGDILLDRGIHLVTRLQKKGIDFPFGGGTVDITSRYCCSTMGWQLPKTKRTGDAGAVRGLLQGADLAIANFENPAPDKWKYHTTGTVFSAEPAKIAALRDAGIDWVSLANNHIRDAGANGILQTRKNLAKVGIEFGGAGKDLAEARAPSLLEVGGQKVALLAYDTIAPSYWATSSKVGSAKMTAPAVKADVAAARAAGADVVIVFPHWGIEYKNTATKAQRDLAHAAIDAGADLVIGSHSHWAGAMEVYKGRPVWYSLGNFVFDQVWSEQTMEGLLLELTFSGDRLVQARIRPHLILDRAQPNLLDPAGDGKVVLDRVWKGSGKLLPW